MSEDRHDGDFMDHFVGCQAYIYAYLRSLVVHGADTEELFQQVALTLWSKRESFDPERGTFRSWAIGVAHNHVRNFVRHQAVDKRTLVFSTDVVDRIAECHGELSGEWDERQKALSQCLTKIDEPQRTWLKDYYGGVRKPWQIAKAGGMSLRTFYRKVQKLREVLLRCIVDTIGREADAHVG